MGHDVHIIGNHNLDTSSLENLSKDISKRFKANVEYGVNEIFEFDSDGLECEHPIENCVFGKIKYPNAETTLWLADEYYMYHIVLEKHGKNAYNLPYFTMEDGVWRDELDEADGNKQYELRDNVNNKEYAVIFNDTLHDWYNHFDSRWWSFCAAFTEKYNQKENITWLNKAITPFRKKVMQFFDKVGGTEAYYLDDQGETQYLTESYYNWDKIKHEIETNFKNTTLHLSEFMKKSEYEQWTYEPQAYYEDFEDIK